MAQWQTTLAHYCKWRQPHLQNVVSDPAGLYVYAKILQIGLQDYIVRYKNDQGLY